MGNCVRAKQECTLILAGLPVANVRSWVAFRTPFGIPADFLRGLTVANSLLGSLALWVRPGVNRLLGTSSPACSVLLISCSVLVWFGSLVASDVFQIIWRLVVVHVSGKYVVEGFQTSYSWCAFISFSALLRANSCRVSQWTADTVDQILTEVDAMYVKAFDDGTIPDTETLSLMHLPDCVRWPTMTVDPAKLNQLSWHC